MKKNIKITIWIILLIILWVVWKYSYNYYNNQKVLAQEEQENIKIDEYNFEQLEKVKNILDWLDKNSYSFENLKEFNEKFNENIEPIKNCYFLSDRNSYFENLKWWWGYIFGFKLYSDKYQKELWEQYLNHLSYYTYPKYDLPSSYICDWWNCDWDIIFGSLIKTISNPCED